MVEAPVLSLARSIPAARDFEQATPISDVELASVQSMPTGVSELDRVLGGGFVPGSVTLIGGEPGVGKSTLLTQVAASMAFAGLDVLYVSAEESRQQVRLRAGRLGALAPKLWLASETELGHVLAQADRVQPGLIVVDSIQSVHDPALGSAPGSTVQVRECAHRLVREAKQRNLAVVLVGHVTKEGGLAGPRVLEHVVDTVLCFDGDRHHALRLLRAAKHRFGSTADLGLFEMTESGLEPVPDASALFLADRRPGVPGSAVVPTLDGHRPMLVELQALVAKTNLPLARRSAQGVDGGRLAFLLAVLERRGRAFAHGVRRVRARGRWGASRRTGSGSRARPRGRVVTLRHIAAVRSRRLRRDRAGRRVAPSGADAASVGRGGSPRVRVRAAAALGA